MSIVLGGRCDSAEPCQQSDPRTGGGRSNHGIINLLITDSLAVSNIKQVPCCFSAPLSKNIEFRGQMNLFGRSYVKVSEHAHHSSLLTYFLENLGN